jgi:hypothetical protein
MWRANNPRQFLTRPAIAKHHAVRETPCRLRACTDEKDPMVGVSLKMKYAEILDRLALLCDAHGISQRDGVPKWLMLEAGMSPRDIKQCYRWITRQRRRALLARIIRGLFSSKTTPSA